MPPESLWGMAKKGSPETSNSTWLVVDLPRWKIWTSPVGIIIPNTLWLFSIAMENGPFIDGLPMAMLNNQMVYGKIKNVSNHQPATVIFHGFNSQGHAPFLAPDGMIDCTGWYHEIARWWSHFRSQWYLHECLVLLLTPAFLRESNQTNIPSSKFSHRPCPESGVGRWVSIENWWFSGSTS